MKNIKITLLILIILITTTGCWDYKEIDELSIVAGVAIDKGTKNLYEMTVEIIDISSGKDAKTKSKMIAAEGKTMIDAGRNIISMSGKKLYWSHSKVIIISKEIASEGVTRVIEAYTRESESREDNYLLISEGESAKEVFNEKGKSEDVTSLTLASIIKSQMGFNKAPITDILKFNIESKTKGGSTVIPAIKLKKIEGEPIPQIMGSAIIKNDKLVGFLNEEETKTLLFIRNEVKGGILIEEMKENDPPTLVSLKIFKNKTKVTPVVNGKDIKIDLDIDTTVGIGEIEGKGDFFNEEGKTKLEESAQNTLKKRIESLISKVQSEYDADIFGFGSKLQGDKAQVWKSVSNNWEEVFKGLKVDVKTKVHIKNSGILSKSIEEED